MSLVGKLLESRLPPEVVGAELVDHTGQPAALGALCPAVVVWLRHYG